MEQKVLALITEARSLIWNEWFYSRKEKDGYADYCTEQMKIIDECRRKFEQKYEDG